MCYNFSGIYPTNIKGVQSLIERLQKLLDQNPFKPLTDAIYEIVLEDIIEFNVLPESKLVVTSLADELHVSRTPVKEALMRLCDERMVEFKKNKGFYVAPFNSEDYAGYFRLRTEIEAYAARITCRRITPQQLKELRAFTEALSPHNDTITKNEYCRREWNFHSAIVRFSGNPYYISAHQRLYTDFQRYNIYTFNDRLLHTTYYEHHKFIYNAIRLGNPDACEAAIRAHLTDYPASYDKDYLAVLELYRRKNRESGKGDEK